MLKGFVKQLNAILWNDVKVGIWFMWGHVIRGTLQYTCSTYNYLHHILAVFSFLGLL